MIQLVGIFSSRSVVVVMVPGVGLWRIIPFFYSIGEVPEETGLETSTEVMYNIPNGEA